MLEVPSLLFDLNALMKAVDFVSIGSNDLFQFLTATDRGNPQIAARFEPLSRPFLRALRTVAEAAERNGTQLTLCGELAGKPLSALALAAIGIRDLSMSAASIGPVKAALLATDVGALAAVIGAAIENDRGSSDMQNILRDFADENAIPYN
jgi:phosphotransferase system enzyme I (PtsP)